MQRDTRLLGAAGLEPGPPPPPGPCTKLGGVLRGLSRLAQCILAAFVLQFAIAAALYWPMAFIYPLLAVTPAALVHLMYARWTRTEPPSDELFIRFAGAMTYVFLPLAGLLNAVLFALVAEACIGAVDWALVAWAGDAVDITTARQGYQAAYVVFMLVTSVIVAPVVEETAKLATVRLTVCTSAPWCVQTHASHSDARTQVHNTIAFMLSAAVSFALAENVVYVERQALLSSQVFVALVRSLLCIPGHVFYGLFTALRLSIRDAQLRAQECSRDAGLPGAVRVWSLPRVLWPAMVAHGAYNFSVSLGDIGVCLGVLVTGATYILLSRQYAEVLPYVLRGEIPPNGATCASHVLCLPCWGEGWCGGCCRGRVGLVGEGGGTWGPSADRGAGAAWPVSERSPATYVSPSVADVESLPVPAASSGAGAVPVASSGAGAVSMALLPPPPAQHSASTPAVHVS